MTVDMEVEQYSADADCEESLQEFFHSWKQSVLESDDSLFENLVALDYFESLEVFKTRESLEKTDSYLESEDARKFYKESDPTLYYSCIGYWIVCEDIAIYEDEEFDFLEVSKIINNSFSDWFKENSTVGDDGESLTLLEWLNQASF